MRQFREMRHRLKFGGKVFTSHLTAAWYSSKRDAEKDAKVLRTSGEYNVRVVKQTSPPYGYRVYTRKKEK